MRARNLPFLVVLAALPSCSSEHDLASSTKPIAPVATIADSAPNASAPQEPPSSEVQVAVASWDELQAEVARHRGKVVVVDLWSSWCPPCVREFPHLVALQSKHLQDVVCISMNMNYSGLASEPPESFREEVLTFLKKEQATIVNLISSAADSELYKQLDLGAVPAVLVYDREGQLHKRFDNDANAYGVDGFTYGDHVAPLVAGLLAP